MHVQVSSAVSQQHFFEQACPSFISISHNRRHLFWSHECGNNLVESHLLTKELNGLIMEGHKQGCRITVSFVLLVHSLEEAMLILEVSFLNSILNKSWAMYEYKQWHPHLWRAKINGGKVCNTEVLSCAPVSRSADDPCQEIAGTLRHIILRHGCLQQQRLNQCQQLWRLRKSTDKSNATTKRLVNYSRPDGI